jgi:hypothetical protein
MDEMNIKQLVEYLPDKPKIRTVYNWVYHDKIPYYKIGKPLFFNKKKIDEWNKAGRPQND